MTKAVSLKKELRFQQWVDQVAEFNSRPAGMSMTTWCKQQGVATSTFITRLHKVQDRCLDTMQLPTSVASSNLALTTSNSPFVEVSTFAQHNNASSAVFSCGNIKLEVSEDISNEFLIKLIEAMNHAK